MIKEVYRIKFTLASALSIGNGTSAETDSDVLTRKNGDPYIPGSSLAGIYGEIVRDKLGLAKDADEYKNYFGYVGINKNTETEFVEAAMGSRIVTYDANLNNKFVISQRDSVALDEYKTAIDSAKFDYQVVNKGAVFVTYIEVNDCPDSRLTRCILRAFLDGQIRMGAKTSRGLGTIEKVNIKAQKFEFPKDADKWINFDMYSDKDWEKCEVEKEDNNSLDCIKLMLKQEGGISIRQYTTAVAYNGNMPDYAQLSNRVIGEEKMVPVIPGSSWAGAFRHHMGKLGLAPEKIKALFGYVSGEKKQCSRITFSESYIKDSQTVQISRNAIDRFSGGTKEHALYTESSEYNGKTELNITFPKDEDQETIKILCASIADLQEGFLAVGGETSIGRGMFKITAVSVNGRELKPENGKDLSGEDIFTELCKALKGDCCNGQGN